MYNYSIFEYKEFASCSFLGGDTNGFEIEISDSDELNVKYRKFSFDDKETLEYKLYSISRKNIENIKNVIKVINFVLLEEMILFIIV